VLTKDLAEIGADIIEQSIKDAISGKVKKATTTWT
jgi:hypothetical protein